MPAESHHVAEPFGMVMIEALACGTPVVTTGHGAAPEIVEDGVVGFIARGRPGLVKALGRVHEIDRAACRDRSRSASRSSAWSLIMSTCTSG